MKRLLITEEIFQFFFALIMLWLLPFSMPWWIWLLLFFLPDISFIAYSFGPKVGAVFYNLFHHKGLCLLIAGIGILLNIPFLLSFGILFYAHASFDRIFGYGLKYSDSFKNTHLGII